MMSGSGQPAQRGCVAKFQKTKIKMEKPKVATPVVANLDFMRRGSQNVGLVSAHFCHVLQLHRFK